MKSGKPESGGTLKTIERAFMTLEFVARAPSPPSVRDVATSLRHNISSTYNIVNTLIGMGYLTKEFNGSLCIGSRVAVLNAAFERGDDYLQTLRPFVDEIHYETNETVYLTRLTEERVVIQLVAEGTYSLRVTGLTVGFHGSEDQRASGKSILAYLPDPTVRTILARNYPSENAYQIERRFTELQSELQLVRDEGYAFDNEAFEPGICCIAAPFFDGSGSVTGSLAVSAPATRLATLGSVIRDRVITTASLMSEALGAPTFEDPPPLGLQSVIDGHQPPSAVDAREVRGDVPSTR